MQKIGDSTSTANGSGEFTHGQPGSGVDATQIMPAWLNTIQRELVNVVLGAGLTLEPTDDSQLLKAIQAIQTAANTWEKLAGKPTTISGFGLTDAFTRTETSTAIQQAISDLVGSSPASLDTLKELADALGSDPNFATTMMNALAGKASIASIQSQTATAFTSAGATPAFTLTPSPKLTTYAAGQRFRVRFHAPSTGSDTMNWSALGSKSLKQYDFNGGKVSAIFTAGQLADVEYDGTDIVMLNTLPPDLKAADTLNTLRIAITTASQIDLTAAAPTTQHINITGGGTITGFTVAPGQCFFVRFASPITLVNNAAIVTQSGSNIAAQAGDTCVIRATAANAVEVLMYTPAVIQAIGYGQTWQDVISSRAMGTTYTNSTGRPIAVSVTIIGGSPGLQLVINGLIVSRQHCAVASGSVYSNLQAVIPPGATYSAVLIGGSLSTWTELR